ncbi:MAG: LamG domain-containing protein [Planctomycetales bacterium]|nr:LamG domain-containing protein [Planctomycetales bacterium]
MGLPVFRDSKSTVHHGSPCAAILFWIVAVNCSSHADTIALWLFDEPRALYPSSVLDSSSENDYPLVIGQGGHLVAGKFGNALEPTDRRLRHYPPGPRWFGLDSSESALSDVSVPMSWSNSYFAALMTSGERHLRKEVGFANATQTDLNLGPFDWTVEFWYLPTQVSDAEGVVFELGLGPLGTEHQRTSLVLEADNRHFRLRNDPSKADLRIPTDASKLELADRQWHHLAFVYDASAQQIRHYVDGVLQELPAPIRLQELRDGEDAYLSLARNGLGDYPLPGALDELRFSTGQVYSQSFAPPQSFGVPRLAQRKSAGPPLLFDSTAESTLPIPLGTRKHLFLDDALIAEIKNCQFVVNPPRLAERVIDGIRGSFRKHLTVVEDETGVIRIYNSLNQDQLAVFVSNDGVHFEAPEVELASSARHVSPGVPLKKKRQADPPNLVIPEMVGGLGNPFIDPGAPDEERWKYFSDYHRRGIYLYTSPDGYHWKRLKTAILPFRSGTQSCTFYDDQRQRYVSYHRSGIYQTPGGDTQRSSVVTEHKDLREPLDFDPLSQEDYLARRETLRLRNPLPWYLDNGPLTPGGFGMEYPHAFDPLSNELPGTDIYITKAQKYEWAPDAYMAFPTVYFHYEPDGPPARNVLAQANRQRGSGPVETQLSVSRDGIHWTRHPRPAYVGIGNHAGRDVVTAYLAHGMVSREKEIWQYYFGETQYHSAHKKDALGRAVYRLVQRKDGFVSLDSPYDSESFVRTKPFTFTGNRLTLNVDTEATGFVQVGFLDAHGDPIEGYTLDDCIYVNGDFIDTGIEFLDRGLDVSPLAGKTVQLVFRMRGSKLYAMQFVD